MFLTEFTEGTVEITENSDVDDSGYAVLDEQDVGVELAAGVSELHGLTARRSRLPRLRLENTTDPAS